MSACQALKGLREKKGLTQEKLADKLHVTRQAVSRWELGETTPGPETLKELSKLYGVSINTLLGSPRKLICQCCGMPLEDDGVLSREPDGSINETYCKWCYTEGKFTYQSVETLVDFLVKTMSGDKFPPEQARAYFSQELPKLAHWRKEAQ